MPDEKTVKETLDELRTLCNQHFQAVESDIWCVNPGSRSVHTDKSYALALMAVTHGNEVGGLTILLEIARLLVAGVMHTSAPTLLILGNSEAAKVRRRFLESDLNRSFMTEKADTWEQRRAKVIEPFLAESQLLVDFHQTREPSESPFFIFPYSPNGVALATAISSDIPVVTHWGAPFSGDGRCTDEFINASGGTGISFETGQAGFCPMQRATGLMVGAAAMAIAAENWGRGNPPIAKPSRFYTWAQVISYDDPTAKLEPGLTNFYPVSKGDLIGDGERGRIVSGTDGRLLFPKYYEGPSESRPAELCRIMKEVSFEELGQDG